MQFSNFETRQLDFPSLYPLPWDCAFGHLEQQVFQEFLRGVVSSGQLLILQLSADVQVLECTLSCVHYILVLSSLHLKQTVTDITRTILNLITHHSAVIPNRFLNQAACHQ